MPHPGPALHPGEIEAIQRRRVGAPPLTTREFEGVKRMGGFLPAIGTGAVVITTNAPRGPVVNPFAPGGTADTLATAACERLTGAARQICLLGVGVFRDQPGPGMPDGSGLTVPCPPTTPGCPGFDPTPGVDTPGERSIMPQGAPSLQAPFAVQRTVLQCPTFGNGKVGILWMSALDGQIICLPRGVNGLQFGLIRKNKPPTKPLFTGGDMNCLRRATRLQKKFRKIDKLFGATARKRGR